MAIQTPALIFALKSPRTGGAASTPKPPLGCARCRLPSPWTAMPISSRSLIFTLNSPRSGGALDPPMSAAASGLSAAGGDAILTPNRPLPVKLTRTQAAGTANRVQQSLLYSNFPMRPGSRRGRELLPSKLPIEDHASEVSNSEGSVDMGLSEFTALALNDMSPKLQSTYWSNVCYDTGSSETESETVVENPEEESGFDLEKELQEMEDYLQENTCDTISEAMDKILAVERSTLAAKYDNMSAAERADMTARSSYFRKRLPPLWWLPSPADSETQSLQSTEQASRNEPSRQCLLRRQPRCEVPDGEIIQNGKNWMTKEVMLAFEEYAERSTNLRDLDWQIEELRHQCFNVEYYHKVFHHYNFTVKIESPKSSDSRVALFFAEVKEIFGRKYYFCCPLEPNENGQCYACHNQGVDNLRHPATGGYDRGSMDIGFPFTCID